MKVFLSHARKDSELARQLGERLSHKGFTVWDAGDNIEPGDNWAKKIGEALDEAELMVILLTPAEMDSEWLRRDIEFALHSKKWAGRVFSVFVGPTLEAGRDMPWILLKLPNLQVETANDFKNVADEIQAHYAGST